MDKLVYWKDNWKPEPLSNTLPELFSFAKNKTISVPTAFEQDQLTNLFHLPLSEVSFVQLQSLSFDLNSLSLLENNDIWRLSSNSDLFSSTKVNRKLLGTIQVQSLQMDVEILLSAKAQGFVFGFF
jgi:hypothetical protein